ncbi:aldehyde dehydrogenase family protein [Maribrevibacterium harenarium]|uniref:Aldehyde dehydrogenase family protein n=1 Tax=Maribrevibacterium harenarium TaxID=2589817 RepID=A0A501WL24_9GAMM|nr:aldehyde dehydrogenase family protein [Maribrevibacterium harenarium]TPE49472.1 aldehyde dehydrogenase family protein [Maribrevibacterium harenarium]
MQTKLYINGEFLDAENGATLDVINPADETVLATIANSSSADAQSAVEAARHAFDHGEWPSLTGTQRAQYLYAIADGIRANFKAISEMETMDNGKPYPEAEWDITDAADCFTFYGKLAEELDQNPEEEVKLGDARFTSKAIRQPIGVAGLIVPFNFPLLMAAWKVAPALAAGCTAVLKPSTQTPMTALWLAKIAHEAGLPKGVLNIITGGGSAITSSPLVDKLAFTGSVETGSTVMKAAAAGIKPVTLELGGKSALIIFDDTDIDAAVEWTMFGIFWNKGEVCSATSRVLVHEGIYDAFLARLVEETQKISIGNGLESGVKMGPAVSAKQYSDVMSYIEKGKAEGLRLLTGGKRPAGFDKGYFIEPTVFADVPTDSALWKEEIFGPVVCVRAFSTEEEAVKLANDSEFGLAGAVMSKDRERLDRVARNLDAGIIWTNCSQPTFVEAPWGGRKKSGIGRELGYWGLHNYLTVKQITDFNSDEPWGWYLD